MITTLLFSQEITTDSIIEPLKIDDKYLSGLDIPKLKLQAHPERVFS